MPTLVVTTRGGEVVILEGRQGQVVMEIIRDSNINEISAICGGCASCATCHVYVDREFSHRLPRMSQQEDDLLYACEGRNERSRLACQIPFDDGLDGLKVTIAPEG